MRGSFVVMVCALCAILGVSAYADECTDPGDNTICSGACPNMGACYECCGTQYVEKTQSNWGFIRWMKRLILYNELQGCQRNCDFDEIGFTYVPVLEDNVEFDPYVSGDESGIVLTFPATHFQVFVADPRDGVGRVTFSSGGDTWVALRGTVSELYVESPKGVELLCTGEDGIDANARDLFEEHYDDYGSQFKTDLETIVAVSDSEPEISIVVGFGPLLKELMGN